MVASVRRRSRNILTLALLVTFVAGNRAWPAAPWWPHPWTDLWWTLTFGAAAVACARTERAAPAEDRAAWRWITAGAVAFVAGQLAWNYAEMHGHLAPFPYWSDAGWLACGVLTTVGFSLLVDWRSLRATPGAAADLGTLLAGFALIVLAGAWGAFDRSVLPPLARVTAGAYIAVYLAQLCASCALLWSPSPPAVAVARSWLIASSTANVLGFVVWQFPLLAGAYTPGQWFDALWVASGMSLAIAAAEFRHSYAEGNAAALPATGARVHLWSMLQIAGLLFLGLLDYLYRLPGASLLLGGAALVAMLSARQVYVLLEERQATRDRARLLEAATLLATAASDIAARLDRDAAVLRALETARQVFGCRDIVIRLVDADGTLIHTVAIWSDPAHGAAVAEPRLDGINAHCCRTRESVFTSDMTSQPLVHPANARFGVRAVAAAPLIGPRGCLGSLVAYFDSARAFPAVERRLIEAFANVLAAALENARLFAQVQEQMEQIRTTQWQLVQAEKLSALGQLIFGAAHELNNPLTAVLGSVHLAERIADDPAVRRHLEIIRISGERAAQIVRSLLQFARKSAPSREMVDINALLERVLELTAITRLTTDLTVVRDFAHDLPPIVGDASQLQQAILNVVANGCQAMAGTAGTLTIRTRASAGAVRVEVDDTGPGVPPGVRRRIFDPFFTTKSVGEGTGLGLSVADGIVAGHEGRIWLDDTAPAGARFIIELPVRAPDAALTAEGR